MKSLFITLIYFVVTSITAAAGQQVYQLTVVDGQDGRVISKATIKVISKSIVVETDLYGRSTISAKDISETDTLLISNVGYVTKKVPVYGLAKSFNIKLFQDIQTLKELIVFKTKRKSVILNKVNKTIPFLSGLKLAAQKMFAPEEGALLASVLFVRDIEKGNNPQAKFKVHVYDEDLNTGGPGVKLLESGSEVTDIANEKINVDLKNYNIIIPGKVFFVGIEWLYIPFNQYISFRQEMLPVTDYENGQRVPWTDYIGSSDYFLGTQGAAPKDDKTYQKVKIVSTAQASKFDGNGKLIQELVTSLGYHFNPQLKAVVGNGKSHIWIMQNESDAKWESNIYRPGAKLALSVTIIY
ncbi:MAG: hypothetical protein H7069_07730 [Phormidesmis sp. FL-bin-119]|nr:hypothetical protein [Pedobacter sp.]